MGSPLSPNWPLVWIGVFNAVLSPVQAVLLPKFPQAWRYTIAALACYLFTIVAAWRTPLEMSEVLVQGGILLGMVMGGYAAARSNVGIVSALGAAAAGGAASGALAMVLPAFAQDPTVAEGAKVAAAESAKFWLAWALSVIGGKIGRWLDGMVAQKARHETA